MALPFLPHKTIEATFEGLRPEATTQPLKEFVLYIGETLINSRVWHPKCWSVFMLSVRTNNDIEGWHHALQLACVPATQWGPPSVTADSACV